METEAEKKDAEETPLNKEAEKDKETSSSIEEKDSTSPEEAFCWAKTKSSKNKPVWWPAKKIDFENPEVQSLFDKKKGKPAAIVVYTFDKEADEFDVINNESNVKEYSSGSSSNEGLVRETLTILKKQKYKKDVDDFINSINYIERNIVGHGGDSSEENCKIVAQILRELEPPPPTTTTSKETHRYTDIFTPTHAVEPSPTTPASNVISPTRKRRGRPPISDHHPSKLSKSVPNLKPKKALLKSTKKSASLKKQARASLSDKKFVCDNCNYETDRVSVLTHHRKSCKRPLSSTPPQLTANIRDSHDNDLAGFSGASAKRKLDLDYELDSDTEEFEGKADDSIPTLEREVDQEEREQVKSGRGRGRGRGRRKSNDSPQIQQQQQRQEPLSVKRGRGRGRGSSSVAVSMPVLTKIEKTTSTPNTVATPSTSTLSSSAAAATGTPGTGTIKRKRGRPSKKDQAAKLEVKVEAEKKREDILQDWSMDGGEDGGKDQDEKKLKACEIFDNLIKGYKGDGEEDEEKDNKEVVPKKEIKKDDEDEDDEIDEEENLERIQEEMRRYEKDDEIVEAERVKKEKEEEEEKIKKIKDDEEKEKEKKLKEEEEEKAKLKKLKEEEEEKERVKLEEEKERVKLEEEEKERIKLEKEKEENAKLIKEEEEKKERIKLEKEKEEKAKAAAKEKEENAKKEKEEKAKKEKEEKDKLAKEKEEKIEKNQQIDSTTASTANLNATTLQQISAASTLTPGMTTLQVRAPQIKQQRKQSTTTATPVPTVTPQIVRPIIANKTVVSTQQIRPTASTPTPGMTTLQVRAVQQQQPKIQLTTTPTSAASNSPLPSLQIVRPKIPNQTIVTTTPQIRQKAPTSTPGMTTTVKATQQPRKQLLTTTTPTTTNAVVASATPLATLASQIVRQKFANQGIATTPLIRVSTPTPGMTTQQMRASSLTQQPRKQILTTPSSITTAAVSTPPLAIQQAVRPIIANQTIATATPQIRVSTLTPGMTTQQMRGIQIQHPRKQLLTPTAVASSTSPLVTQQIVRPIIANQTITATTQQVIRPGGVNTVQQVRAIQVQRKSSPSIQGAQSGQMIQIQQAKAPTVPGIVQQTTDPNVKPPIALADQVVHLVPVENPDGSVIYMFLSLNNKGEINLETVEESNINANNVKTEQVGESANEEQKVITGIYQDKDGLSSGEIIDIIQNQTLDSMNKKDPVVPQMQLKEESKPIINQQQHLQPQLQMQPLPSQQQLHQQQLQPQQLIQQQSVPSSALSPKEQISNIVTSQIAPSMPALFQSTATNNQQILVSTSGETPVTFNQELLNSMVVVGSDASTSSLTSIPSTISLSNMIPMEQQQPQIQQQQLIVGDGGIGNVSFGQLGQNHGIPGDNNIVLQQDGMEIGSQIFFIANDSDNMYSC